MPADVQDYVRDGKLSAGHARALIGSPKAAELAAQVVAKGLSVREVERLMKAQDSAKPSTARAARGSAKDADTRALEGDLSANLKMPVRIEHAAGGESGDLVIRYGSLEDLDRLCRILTQLPDED
ncbi:MAG: hypothetical protein EOP21_12560 [Hyphomicrobiales bacterium]|nr:MAG: hypothetical protein EOP21_12560 [Hyphomicrobiales bacterium]